MKSLNSIAIRLSLSIVAIVAIGAFSNCGGDDTPLPSKQEEVTALLIASPWDVNTVSVGGVDKTSVYQDLGLTFTNTSFTSVDGEPIWPASGTWTFTSADATAFTRNDGIVVTIQEITATSLTLAFTWNKTTLNSGKIGSVNGAHVFTFRK